MANLEREVVRRANPLEVVIPSLTGDVVRAGAAERFTRCPFHDDQHPSLRINVEKQRWYCDPCQTGGDVFEFVQRFRDMAFSEALTFLAERAGLNGNGPSPNDGPGDTEGGRGGTSPRKQYEHSNTSAHGVALAHYAEAKGLPEVFVCDLGVTEITVGGRSALRIPYFGEDGAEQAVQLRLALAKGERDARFKWRKGSKPCPYGLWRLEDARTEGRLALVEGASDTQTLWWHGISALGLPSASFTLDQLDGLLDGFTRIDVVIEPDRGGQTVLAGVAKTAFRDQVWLVTLGDANDPSELHLRDPEKFLDQWRLVTEAAQRWSDLDATERSERVTVTFRAAQELLDDPRLIDRIGDTLRARGYAGDVRPALLAYLALTSRLLDRPINLAFVAQSGAGKNTAVDFAKALMPAEAFHEIRACSERALIYDEVEVEHKVVIFAEVDSIPEEGPAASAVRSLASDNVMEYATVEKDAGRLRTRHIRKPGPTGLITTSTKRLPEQMSTRTLEVPIPDDERQTRAVLLAQAAEAAAPVTRPDVEDFIALQRWLADAGASAVWVPFAYELAAEVPARAVRMRRDHWQLLACVKASAVLHQRQRETRDGRIVAAFEDYAIARDLLASVFDALSTDGCTPAVRETVEAVRDDEELSASALADRLGVARSTLSSRAKRAMAGGWLVNEETGRGRPARYRRGSPLPEQISALPRVERVRELFECSTRHPGEVVPPPPYKEF